MDKNETLRLWNRYFVAALTGLCADPGIEVVDTDPEEDGTTVVEMAEMVADEALKVFLKKAKESETQGG